MKVIGAGRVPIKAWIEGVELEDEARKQLLNVANPPFVFKHVAVMPDVHFGKGATVGSVIAIKGAVVTAAVGVDIGCGMVARKTTLTANDLPDDLHALRTAIEAAVPHLMQRLRWILSTAGPRRYIRDSPSPRRSHHVKTIEVHVDATVS